MLNEDFDLEYLIEDLIECQSNIDTYNKEDFQESLKKWNNFIDDIKLLYKTFMVKYVIQNSMNKIPNKE